MNSPQGETRDWFVDQYGHIYGWQEIGNKAYPDRKSVILLDGRYSAATHADKLKMAAAQDMAEALSACLGGIYKGSVEYRIACAALKKAGVG